MVTGSRYGISQLSWHFCPNDAHSSLNKTILSELLLTSTSPSSKYISACHNTFVAVSLPIEQLAIPSIPVLGVLVRSKGYHSNKALARFYERIHYQFTKGSTWETLFNLQYIIRVPNHTDNSYLKLSTTIVSIFIVSCNSSGQNESRLIREPTYRSALSLIKTDTTPEAMIELWGKNLLTSVFATCAIAKRS